MEYCLYAQPPLSDNIHITNDSHAPEVFTCQIQSLSCNFYSLTLVSFLLAHIYRFVLISFFLIYSYYSLPLFNLMSSLVLYKLGVSVAKSLIFEDKVYLSFITHYCFTEGGYHAKLVVRNS